MEPHSPPPPLPSRKVRPDRRRATGRDTTAKPSPPPAEKNSLPSLQEQHAASPHRHRVNLNRGVSSRVALRFLPSPIETTNSRAHLHPGQLTLSTPVAEVQEQHQQIQQALRMRAARAAVPYTQGSAMSLLERTFAKETARWWLLEAPPIDINTSMMANAYSYRVTIHDSMDMGPSAGIVPHETATMPKHLVVRNLLVPQIQVGRFVLGACYVEDFYRPFMELIHAIPLPSSEDSEHQARPVEVETSRFVIDLDDMSEIYICVTFTNKVRTICSVLMDTSRGLVGMESAVCLPSSEGGTVPPTQAETLDYTKVRRTCDFCCARNSSCDCNENQWSRRVRMRMPGANFGSFRDAFSSIPVVLMEEQMSRHEPEQGMPIAFYRNLVEHAMGKFDPGAAQIREECIDMLRAKFKSSLRPSSNPRTSYPSTEEIEEHKKKNRIEPKRYVLPHLPAEPDPVEIFFPTSWPALAPYPTSPETLSNESDDLPFTPPPNCCPDRSPKPDSQVMTEVQPQYREPQSVGSKRPRETFQCMSCMRSFDQRRHLVQHVKVVHDLIRAHQCPLCDRSFGAKSNLRRHIRMVHDRVRDKKCQLCPSSFCEAADLRRHMRIMHDVIVHGGSKGKRPAIQEYGRTFGSAAQ